MVIYEPEWVKATARWRWIRRRFCWLLGHETFYNDVVPDRCRWCGKPPSLFKFKRNRSKVVFPEMRAPVPEPEPKVVPWSRGPKPGSLPGSRMRLRITAL